MVQVSNELQECLVRADALQRALELSALLSDLITRMEDIVSEINKMKEVRLGQRARFQLPELLLQTFSDFRFRDSPIKKMGVIKERESCESGLLGLMGQLDRLQYSIRLLGLSPNNGDVQFSLHCNAYNALLSLVERVADGRSLTKTEYVAISSRLNKIKNEDIMVLNTNI
ncbi:hypothetical protein SK128_003754, partial [Halocaridina rubra]